MARARLDHITVMVYLDAVDIAAVVVDVVAPAAAPAAATAAATTADIAITVDIAVFPFPKKR